MTAPALLIEQLARRVAARLPHAAEALRHGQPVQMRRETLTLLFVDGASRDALQAETSEHIEAEIGWLAARHGGTVDEFAEHGILVAFEHATAGVDMALDLQQADLESQLRIAVSTVSCLRLRFEHAGQCFETLLGVEDDLLARAAGGGDGGIRVSPSTYALVRDALQPDYSSTLGAQTEPAALQPLLDLDLDEPAA